MMEKEKKHNETPSTILLVDDDPNILRMLRTVLEDQGFTVLVADNGNSALEILNRNKGIDLVITDVIMPGKEGIGLIRSIRSDDKNLKIIAMTSATNYENILQTAISFGADETLKKPFSIDELITKVDSLIARPKSSSK